MTDHAQTDDVQAAIERGRRAAATLANMEAADLELKADLHLQWETCQAPGIRENIWHQINGINAARGVLWLWVSEGQRAEASIATEGEKQAKAAAQPRRRGLLSVVA